MAAISTENRFTREKHQKQESDADDKEKDLDCCSVRGDRERPISDDEQDGAKSDNAKHFLTYEERSW